MALNGNEWNNHVDHVEKQLPEISIDSHKIGSYNISNLVLWFSNLTRYGTNLEPIYNVTLFKEREYAEILGIYAAMATIVALTLTLILLIFCCCNCFFRSARRTPKYKTPNDRHRRRYCCGTIVLLLAIIGALTFAIGFVGEVRLHNGADDVCQTIDLVQEKTSKIHDDTLVIKEQSKLDSLLNQLETPLSNAQNAISSSSLIPSEMKNQIDEIVNQYQTVKKQITNAQSTINNQLLDNKYLDDLIDAIEPIQTECPNVTKYLQMGNLIILTILAITSLLFIIGLINNCLRIFISIIGYLMFNVILIFGIVSFLFLIIGSDFCITAKPLAERHEPKLAYYLYCDYNQTIDQQQFRSKRMIEMQIFEQFPTFSSNYNAIDKPLNELFDDVRRFIEEASSYTNKLVDTLKQVNEQTSLLCNSIPLLEHSNPDKIEQLEQICKTLNDSIAEIDRLVVKDDHSLISRIGLITSSVTRIIDVVDCRSITPIIDKSLTNVCTRVYEAFFFFLINSICSTICYFLLLLVSIRMILQ